MLNYCLDNNLFGYLSLLCKYADGNNEKLLKDIITSSDQILLSCLKSENVNDYEFIKDYVVMCHKFKYCFSRKTLDESIAICQNNPRLNEYQSIITQTFVDLDVHSGDSDKAVVV